MVKNWQGNIREKHHCLTLNKWWQWQSDVWENHQCLASNKYWPIDDKMMFGRIIIIVRQIIDSQTMIKLCYHRLTSNIGRFSQKLSSDDHSFNAM